MEPDQRQTPAQNLPQNPPAAEVPTAFEAENTSLKNQLLQAQAELGRAYPFVQQAQATDRLHRRLIHLIQEERVSPGLAIEALGRVNLDLMLEIGSLQTRAVLQQLSATTTTPKTSTPSQLPSKEEECPRN